MDKSKSLVEQMNEPGSEVYFAKYFNLHVGRSITAITDPLIKGRN